VPESHAIGAGVAGNLCAIPQRAFSGCRGQLGGGARREKVYIWRGVEPDSSGYPDCRPTYYRAFNEVVKTGTKDGTIQVVTPLIAMRKVRLWAGP